MGKVLISSSDIATAAKVAPLPIHVAIDEAGETSFWTNDGDGDGKPDGVAETNAVIATAVNHGIDFEFSFYLTPMVLRNSPPYADGTVYPCQADVWFTAANANRILAIIAPTAQTF